jgi:hypothetical protein
MLAAQFKQYALMPLAVSPLFSALVGGSDLVHLGACGKLSLEKFEGDKRLMCWGLNKCIICGIFVFGGMFGLAVHSFSLLFLSLPDR